MATVRLKFNFKVWTYLVQACLKGVVNANVIVLAILFPKVKHCTKKCCVVVEDIFGSL